MKDTNLLTIRMFRDAININITTSFSNNVMQRYFGAYLTKLFEKIDSGLHVYIYPEDDNGVIKCRVNRPIVDENSVSLLSANLSTLRQYIEAFNPSIECKVCGYTMNTMRTLPYSDIEVIGKYYLRCQNGHQIGDSSHGFNTVQEAIESNG